MGVRQPREDDFKFLLSYLNSPVHLLVWLHIPASIVWGPFGDLIAPDLSHSCAVRYGFSAVQYNVTQEYTYQGRKAEPKITYKAKHMK